MKKKDENPQVRIAGAIGGTLIAMILAVVIFAQSSAWVIAPLAGFMSLLGIMLGYFSRNKK